MNVFGLVAVLALTIQTPPAGPEGSEAAPQATRAEGVEVVAEANPDSLTIGDRLTVTVSVKGAAPGRVAFPVLPDTGAVTALTGPRVIEAAADGVQSALYEMAVWRVGELELPAAEVVLEKDGEELTLPFPEVRILVTSVLPAQANPDTLAWRPPWDVVGANWSLAEKLSAAGLALALILATLLYVRRRRAVGQPFPGIPGKSPRERALGALEILAASGLLDVGELKAFYSELSRIMREFLAGSERGWGNDLTTFELLMEVSEDGVSDADMQTIADLLVEADLVKFARRRPAAGRPEMALQRARIWIESFERPRAVAPVADEDSDADAEAGVEAPVQEPTGGETSGEAESVTS